MITFDAAKKLLDEKNQSQVLRYFDSLSEGEKESLLKQIENINWSDFEKIGSSSQASRGSFLPPPALSIDEINQNKDSYKKTGLDSIKKGQVAAVLLAGGMGTRLGFDLPKGCFNVGLTRELYIFECLINNLLDVVKEAGVYVPLYIMTSEKNDQATQNFFKEHNYFGYDKDYVKREIFGVRDAIDRGYMYWNNSGKYDYISPDPGNAAYPY